MTNSKAGPPKRIPDSGTLEKDPAYTKVHELEFSEMIPFVLSNIRKRGIIPLLYLGINLIFLFLIIIIIVGGVRLELLTAWSIIWQLFGGFLAGSILVIVPHELLHGLAYWLLGARKIQFGADLQQFIFYVTAHRFTISKGELAFLAMTPFVLINLALITLTLIWAREYMLFSATLLFCHNIMCIGDFAILNYAFTHRGELYTYDDTLNKKSFFFTREGKG
jgi:hypothetical protein